MKARTRKRTKDEALLTQVAESIGSALGTIASKVNAAHKSLSRSSAVHKMEREGKRLLRKGKRIVRTNQKATAANLRRSKIAKAAKRGVRRAAASTKRAVRRGTARVRSARRTSGRK